MMELLSGPHLVARVGEDSAYTGPYDTNRAFWDDELGIGSLAGYTTAHDAFGYGANYFIAQLDGTCGARAKAFHGAVLVDLSGQYEWALYDANFNADLGAPTGYVYGLDKQSGVYADKLIAMSAGIYANPVIFPQIRTNDRLISIHGAAVTKRALDGSDADWITECTLTPGPSDPIYAGQVPSVSRTKDPGIVCLIYPSGGILFYDVFAKQQVVKPWIARIGANKGAWYSVKFDIYVSYTISGGEWYVSVWANSVRPATLSNPEPLTSVASATITQLRVRLLGDHDEPCEGELISWSITDGSGSLTAPQSKTNAEGYAYIGYVAPITGGSTSTIQAVAEF
jgi:hypothetical protein